LTFAAFGAEQRVGVARVEITPEGPIWLSGYASRNKPSEGVARRIWAKALAFQDDGGRRVVIVTTDLVGLPRAITDVVGARVEKDYKLDRASLLLNSSHTHTGPVVRPNLSLMYDLSPEQDRVVRDYAVRLTDALVSVIGHSIADLKPARVSFGTGEVDFAANRRHAGADGVKIGVNPGGPVDHSVPVLRISDTSGRLRAVLFGYACHNTTLTGEFYRVSGDYAGEAQAAIESAEPGVTALFIELCAGDQNPNPRSEVKYVEQHGGSLAKEVRRVLDTKLEPVDLKLRAALQWQDLPLQPHTREDFEKMVDDRDVYRARLAKAMLKAYDERTPPRSISYPVQALRLGRNVAVVALGGEPVVEYGLWTKKTYPKMKLIVAGYSNDVAGYVPTTKMLAEGGYEPITSQIYYGWPAPFTTEVEDRVHAAIRQVLSRVGVK
jgi:hypothetical protein